VISNSPTEFHVAIKTWEKTNWTVIDIPMPSEAFALDVIQKSEAEAKLRYDIMTSLLHR